MKLLSAPLAALILTSFPTVVFGQSELGDVPEGRLLLSQCPADQSRSGDTCLANSIAPGASEAAPELFTLDSAGERQVTDNDLFEFGGAAWAPSGKKVAVSSSPFTRDVEECRAYVVRVATGAATPITPDQDLACALAEDWSPDGEWILMTVRFHDGPIQLYKVRPDGTGLRALTDYHGEGQTVDGARFIDKGRKILHWGSPARTEEIRVMRADGRPIRMLLKVPYSRSSPKLLGPVEVAPNGRRVAFVIYDGSDKTHDPDEVFVIDVDGSHRRRLTFNEIDETALSWGPDGERLAVVLGSMYDADATPGIKIIPVGAGSVVKLERPADGAVYRWGAPVWSPSGDHVAFIVENDSGGEAVYVGDARNGNITRVTDFHRTFDLFSWTP